MVKVDIGLEGKGLLPVVGEIFTLLPVMPWLDDSVVDVSVDLEDTFGVTAILGEFEFSGEVLVTNKRRCDKLISALAMNAHAYNKQCSFGSGICVFF